MGWKSINSTKKKKETDPNQFDLFSDPSEQIEQPEETPATPVVSPTRRSRSENYILQFFPARYNGTCHGYIDICHKDKVIKIGDPMVKLIPGKRVPGPSFILHADGPCFDKGLVKIDEDASKAMKNR